MQKLIVDLQRKKAKAIKLLEPFQLKVLKNPLAIKILEELSKKSSYAIELSKKLGEHEQKIYYHLKALKKAGFINVIRSEPKRGALCQYYDLTAPAFGFELASEEIYFKEQKNSKLRQFLYEFFKDGFFNGEIVVGSPEPHGPYLTSARDSHYAVQLAFFLGNLCSLPENKFIIKLDTEVKAEKTYNKNMILIGGPVANIISQEINNNLKVKFAWEKTWQLISEKKKFIEENHALIAKIRNPWDKNKVIILLAGLKAEGTRGAILALTNHHEKILKNFSLNSDFYAVLECQDKDGDGKIDDVKLLD
ncbi:MAG: S-layer protein [Candidatus Nanoarchaeia archaeon]